MADLTRLGRAGGVGAKTFIAIVGLGLKHGGIDAINHARGVAPRVVATQEVAAQRFTHKFFGSSEHLGLGAAKPVNALLGVAHQENTGRCAARPGVAAEP